MPDRILRPETRDRLLLAMADAVGVLMVQAKLQRTRVYSRLIVTTCDAESELQPQEEEPDESTHPRD